MTPTARAAIVLAALFIAAEAAAQNRPIVTLSPMDPARWDAAGTIGWFGANQAPLAQRWNDWSDSASFGLSTGYYLTPHLKLEVDAGTTMSAAVDAVEQIDVGSPFPVFRSRRLFFRSTALSTGLTYQFLENAWFHPFVGIGIEGSRERTRIESQPLFVPLPGGRPGTVAPAPPPEIVTTYTARPVVSGGFKWYVAERAFIRSDLRSSFSAEHAETVTWRVGIGFDF
jgi:hypothetical protein